MLLPAKSVVEIDHRLAILRGVLWKTSKRRFLGDGGNFVLQVSLMLWESIIGFEMHLISWLHFRDTTKKRYWTWKQCLKNLEIVFYLFDAIFLEIVTRQSNSDSGFVFNGQKYIGSDYLHACNKIVQACVIAITWMFFTLYIYIYIYRIDHKIYYFHNNFHYNSSIPQLHETKHRKKAIKFEYNFNVT